MKPKTPPKLDAFVRKVLAYRPPKDNGKPKNGRPNDCRTPAAPA